jgi:uncharacterized C2H2 Zn-finger protein
MAENGNNNLYRCPHCACIFFSQADLDSHMEAFGEQKGAHDYQYKKTHGRLEHGYSNEE